MAQNFMDVLRKQTLAAPHARLYKPAPEKLPEGPIRVLIIEPCFVQGSVHEPGEKIVLQNGAKEFARTKLPNGEQKKVLIDNAEHKTSFQESCMVFLEDLSAPQGSPAGNGDHKETGANKL